jgi:Raf kinase inhibitor-like YbhB/YbcL family protein
MRIAAIVLVGVAALAACGGDTGATEASLEPSGTASPTPSVTISATASPTIEASAEPTPTINPPTEEPPMPMTLTSTAFAEGGSIPREHTCDGADISPPLAWPGVPGGTAALALIVDDPDAGGFIHWVAYDIDASTSGLDAGASTAAGAPPQGRNSFGRVGYGGPCPPSGTHHYVFRLLALDAPVSSGGTPSAADVLAAASGHILAEARLTGTYRRGG